MWVDVTTGGWGKRWCLMRRIEVGYWEVRVVPLEAEVIDQMMQRMDCEKWVVKKKAWWNW